MHGNPPGLPFIKFVIAVVLKGLLETILQIVLSLTQRRRSGKPDHSVLCEEGHPAIISTKLFWNRKSVSDEKWLEYYSYCLNGKGFFKILYKRKDRRLLAACFEEAHLVTIYDLFVLKILITG